MGLEEPQGDGRAHGVAKILASRGHGPKDVPQFGECASTVASVPGHGERGEPRGSQKTTWNESSGGCLRSRAITNAMAGQVAPRRQ